MRVRPHLALLAALLAMVLAILPPSGVADAQQYNVSVTAPQLNVRTAPSTSSTIVDVLDRGDVVTVFRTVSGEEAIPGNSTWYQTRRGFFIYGGMTRVAGGRGAASDVDLSGRWIDANLSTATVNAMIGSRVVFSAPSTIGTEEFPTPVGRFTIVRRVFGETMDSSTIGIPNDAPGGYYLTGVLYTMYFTNGGTALHYNYWSSDSAFGSRAGSHGCLGLRLADARYFWNFARVGTPVIIHY